MRGPQKAVQKPKVSDDGIKKKPRNKKTAETTETTEKSKLFSMIDCQLHTDKFPESAPRQNSRESYIPDNYTEPHPDQMDWSIENLPPILYQLYPPKDYKVRRPAGMTNIFVDDERLRDLPVLPNRISTLVEEWRVEAWMRMDSRITLKDITDRMIKINGRKTEPNTIQQRNGRFRSIFFLIAWGSTNAKSKELEKKVLAALAEKKIDVRLNTTRGLTPGLKVPALGEAGDRVKIPNVWITKLKRVANLAAEAAETYGYPAFLQHGPLAVPGFGYSDIIHRYSMDRANAQEATVATPQPTPSPASSSPASSCWATSSRTTSSPASSFPASSFQASFSQASSSPAPKPHVNIISLNSPLDEPFNDYVHNNAVLPLKNGRAVVIDNLLEDLFYSKPDVVIQHMQARNAQHGAHVSFNANTGRLEASKTGSSMHAGAVLPASAPRQQLEFNRHDSSENIGTECLASLEIPSHAVASASPVPSTPSGPSARDWESSPSEASTLSWEPSPSVASTLSRESTPSAASTTTLSREPTPSVTSIQSRESTPFLKPVESIPSRASSPSAESTLSWSSVSTALFSKASPAPTHVDDSKPSRSFPASVALEVCSTTDASPRQVHLPVEIIADSASFDHIPLPLEPDPNELDTIAKKIAEFQYAMRICEKVGVPRPRQYRKNIPESTVSLRDVQSFEDIYMPF